MGASVSGVKRIRRAAIGPFGLARFETRYGGNTCHDPRGKSRKKEIHAARLS
jgi:hypothetical protein